MSILIAYASKTGTTAECAAKLKEKLKDAVLVDLSKHNPKIDDYDKIVVGASVRMGKLNNKAVKFLKRNSTGLQYKKPALFICCCNSDELDSYIEKSLPEDIIANISFHESFGGEMDLSRQKGIEKFIVKSIMKNPETSKDLKNGVNEDAIEKFAHRINTL